ncbi:MAG TPA: DUF4388 domain-containing protein [Planctomycetota bacterium]|nr:DUF4388 domain-containing protein [Planctomycetota bacterium]
MSFQGDISSLSLSDLFQNLAANKKTGILKIQSAESERCVLFLNGKIVSYSDDQGFSISSWLVEKEVISGPQLEEAERRYKKAKKKSLGEILRDLRFLPLDEYKPYLSNLIQETLYEVLSFEEGSFEFLEGDPGDDPAHREAMALGLEYTAQSLVMEAARRSDDWQKIRRHLPSESEIYVVTPAVRDRIVSESKDEAMREAVQLLDGTRTLRQVIGKLPFSRFDACGVVAELVVEKKAKPLDASSLAHFPTAGDDPKQSIACLKSILNREPGNSKVLERLAELHEKVGQRDESATCRKILAFAYIEDGDLKEAEKNLRRSLALNPRDIVSWQRLVDTIRQQGDTGKLAAFGGEFADHFKRLGLMEIVRDHLVEMLKVFPDSLKFKLDLAEARFALGEQKACVEDLYALGVDLMKKSRLEEAGTIFQQILKYDSKHVKARQQIATISSGKIVRRKVLRRKLVRAAIACVLLLSIASLIGYDVWVRGELLRVTRDVYADSLLENGRYDEAISRIRAIQEKHPYSYASLHEARILIEALEGKRGKVLHDEPPRPDAGPPAPPKRTAGSKTK